MDLLSSEMLIFSLYLIVALEHSQLLEVGPTWFFMFRAQKPASLCSSDEQWHREDLGVGVRAVGGGMQLFLLLH